MTEVQTILHALKEFDLEPTQIELMDAYWLGAQITKYQPKSETKSLNEKATEPSPKKDLLKKNGNSKHIDVSSIKSENEEGKLPEHTVEEGKLPEHTVEEGKLPEHTVEKGELPEHTVEEGKLPEDTIEVDKRIEESPEGVPIYAESSGLSDFDGLGLRIQTARALPNALDLARALKPLMKQIPSASEKEVDIPATITNIAEMRLWTVILKSKLEQWLDIALVVDRTPSMLAWEQSVLEFRNLLQRQGGFGNVSLWHLDTSLDKNLDETSLDKNLNESKKSKLRLYDQRNHLHKLEHLLDVRARRLVIIISDCVAPAWQDSAMHNFVADLGKKNLVTLLQVLPRKYWHNTLLGSGQPLRVQTRVTVTAITK